MTRERKSERGQSLVELALSFTFLMLLVGGAIDLGRAFFTFITLRDAAQEGAIFGSYEPTDQCGVKDRVRASATSPIDTDGIADANITVSYSGGTPPDPGDGITVQVTYDFEVSMPLLGSVIGGQSFPITAAITDTVMKTTTTSTSCP